MPRGAHLQLQVTLEAEESSLAVHPELTCSRFFLGFGFAERRTCQGGPLNTPGGTNRCADAVHLLNKTKAPTTAYNHTGDHLRGALITAHT